MDGHTLRSAEPEDCSAIARIYNEAITEGRSTFETEPRTAADISGWLHSPRHLVLIAEHGSEITGWARIAPHSTRPGHRGPWRQRTSDLSPDGSEGPGAR